MAADALIRMGCGDEVERWLDGYIPDKAPARRWQIDEEDWREVIGVTSRLGDWCALTCEPYKSADRVFWVVDNGSSHRGRKAIDRLAKQFPNAIMVHTPVHASWLNQVEIVFSVVQRKVLTPKQLRRSQRGHRPARQFRGTVQPGSETVQMGIHHHRPRRLPHPTRPTSTRRTPSRLNPLNPDPRARQHARAASNPRRTYDSDH